MADLAHSLEEAAGVAVGVDISKIVIAGDSGVGGLGLTASAGASFSI